LGGGGEGAVPSTPIFMVSKISDYKKRRQEMIDFLGGVCVKCGCSDLLHIDHIDHNSKSFNISCKWSTHWDILEAELKKCQLLCKPCHHDKTLEEGSYGKGWTNEKRQTHGTVWSYSKYGCRCDLCKTAKSQASKRQRELKKQKVK
jgi:hypothetical protein